MFSFKKIGRSECLLIILLSIVCALISGCATDLVGDPADLSKFETPSGMAIHPNGRYAYVTGSNFDLSYRANDGGALYVVDLETGSLMPSSKRMGSFGTNVVLTEDGKRGYTVTRGDDALVWFNISDDGSSIYCPNAPDSDSLLKCRVILDDNPTFVSMTHSYRIPENGSESDKIDFDLLVVAQLQNARVTAVTVQNDADGSPSFSRESASFVYAASEVLWIGAERFVVTGRAATSLLVVSPAIDYEGHVQGLYSSQGATVPTGQGAYKGRGMTVDPSGRWLYLINQYPNSLLKFDISGFAKDDSASDKAQNTQTMLLPADCSKVVWAGTPENGVLYVSSVVQDSIYVVDPISMEIISTIETGYGPYEMIVRDNTLYVLHFLGQNITSFDISDPVHPTGKKVIIGGESADKTE